MSTKKNTKRFSIIGLDGGQGSGKSTYAHRLMAELLECTSSSAAYLETDYFLVERQYRDGLSAEFFADPENRRKLWDFSRMGHVLQGLVQSGGGIVQIDGLYNRVNGARDRTESFELQSNGTIIIGGPYLLEPELKGLFSKLIFLDAPEEIRLARVVKRNLEEGKTEARAREMFRDYECFYHPYWDSRLGKYDEIIKNY